MSGREIILELPGGMFSLSVDAGGGSVTSNLHYDSLEEFLKDGDDVSGDPLDDLFSYGQYEGAIDALESFVLAAAIAGFDVQSESFITAIQTTLDAIGSNL
jgi:hypothetical protein